MNLTEIHARNIKFQNLAARITQFMPEKNLMESTSVIIRSARQIDRLFPKLLEAKTEMRFTAIMDKLEEEIDEVIYAMDRLTEMVGKDNLRPMNEFVKIGYNLLSLYSAACDSIIEKRITEEV